jgi:hypothetical protein
LDRGIGDGDLVAPRNRHASRADPRHQRSGGGNRVEHARGTLLHGKIHRSVPSGDKRLEQTTGFRRDDYDEAFRRRTVHGQQVRQHGAASDPRKGFGFAGAEPGAAARRGDD